MKTKAIVITGPTSSGKTELAKALQEALLPHVWLHFSVDSLIYALPPSILERCNTKDDWSGVNGSLLYSSAISCLRSLVSAGNRVIFDVVVPNERKAKELLTALDGVDSLTICLSCSWEEIRKRTITRGDRSLSEAERSFKNASDQIKSHAMFDTSKMTPPDLANQILALIRDGETTGKPVASHNSGGCDPSA